MRSRRPNPTIAGVNLPDEIWVLLDELQELGIAPPDDVWQRMKTVRRPPASEYETTLWMLQDLWADGGKAMPTGHRNRARAETLLEALRDAIHERTDGLTYARLKQVAGRHAVPHEPMVYLLDKLRAGAERQRAEQIMGTASEVLGGHGVEALHDEAAYANAYFEDVIALYVNMGDPYVATVLYDTESERFLVAAWGDFQDSHEAAQRVARRHLRMDREDD